MKPWLFGVLAYAAAVVGTFFVGSLVPDDYSWACVLVGAVVGMLVFTGVTEYRDWYEDRRIRQEIQRARCR